MCGVCESHSLNDGDILEFHVARLTDNNVVSNINILISSLRSTTNNTNVYPVRHSATTIWMLKITFQVTDTKHCAGCKLLECKLAHIFLDKNKSIKCHYVQCQLN